MQIGPDRQPLGKWFGKSGASVRPLAQPPEFLSEAERSRGHPRCGGSSGAPAGDHAAATHSPLGAEPKQYRISIGLACPDQATKSLQLVEQLGNALERHRLGLEAFNSTPWLPKGRQRKQAQQGEQPEVVSGLQAVRLTRRWWGKQRRRSPSAKDSWKIDHDASLAPLLEISPLLPEHLVALVEATPSGSRSKRRASQAVATVARALDWSDELVSQLRELGKGSSSSTNQAPRDLLSNEAIEALIDRLSASWQWPVAVAAA
jgi:hypothetical protein